MQAPWLNESCLGAGEAGLNAAGYNTNAVSNVVGGARPGRVERADPGRKASVVSGSAAVLVRYSCIPTHV
jgi:hypothetical protein